MKEIDFELLRKRREKILKMRAEKEEQPDVGIAYELIIDGRHYPVMACFPIDNKTEEVNDKLKYLINGQKS